MPFALGSMHSHLGAVVLVGICLSLSGCGSGGGKSKGKGSNDAHSESPLRLLNLTESPLARCLDGTPAGYYWKPAASPSSTSWIIHFQGGGECATEKSCQERTKTNLGSSKFFPPQRVWKHWLQNDNEIVNPDFHDWHMVFLPYCSGDLWSGQRTKADNTTFGLYFSGHHIIQAVLDELERYPVLANANAKWNLTQARHIVVSGDSAGGFGVYVNIDAVASRYPAAEVVGAPIAGFEFYKWAYTGPGRTTNEKLTDFSLAAMPANLKLWESALNKQCVAAHPSQPGACILMCAAPPYGWKFIKSRLFIIEAQSDEIVLLDHDNFPPLSSWWRTPGDHKEQLQYLKDFHHNETVCLTDAMDAANSNVGVFNPACYIHTLFTDSILIDNRSYRQAFADFFFQRGAPPKLQDDCGELCNPTCKGALDRSQSYDAGLVV